MEVTKDAMKLFMQSLPPNCKFQIISFGTSYESMAFTKKGNYLEYDQ